METPKPSRSVSIDSAAVGRLHPYLCVDTKQQGKLWIIAGPPGAGKSTVHRELLRATSETFALLDKDTIYCDVDESVLTERGGTLADMEGAWYDAVLREAEYKGLFRTAKEIRSYGTNVAISAPMTKHARNTELWAAAIAACGGGEVTLWWVRADKEILRHRLTSRALLRNQTTLARFDAYIDRVQPDVLPAVPHICIDNRGEGFKGVRAQIAAALT